ncbi:MAG: Flp pilus assembly complex ATPase component TadA [Patescibacteria group bacterium]|nr:Flp pilus assembly complex ATPase component TadA [Patescibacteria group bacterium]MCL5093662.1 Flp pilus assembly complex ATPase component TadA [Patescibacteria group bacterium]
MFVKDQNKLVKVISQLKLVSPEQLDNARIENARSGKPLEQVLADMNLISKEDIVKAQAISLDVPYIDLGSENVDQNILKNITKELAEKFMAVPFGFSGGMLNVAMANPNNVQAIDFIEKKSGFRVNPYMASEEGIKSVVEQYQDATVEVSEALKSIDIIPTGAAPKVAGGTSDIAQDAPVTRAVNTILEYAVKARASDIHIEPREKNIKIRYRIDGVLQDTMNLPIHIHAALVSHIKILSNLKIDEHRVPQDGRFQVNFDNREIDVRVSISPIVFGEKVVMRLLDKTSGVITLEQLGVRGSAYEIIEKGSRKPHGMVLATGPTGSGKSTTLYALLSKMNSVAVNIITLEDPVEYHIEGINQIQVNAQVGLTFASGLRSILRQDPDIVMVGEIRDPETAGLAVQSALTGHIVLSTLHTNSAAGVLPRLLDMDIEPYLIASTVSTVIGQRLVRKICPKCKESYIASEALAMAIKKVVGDLLPDKAGDSKELGYQNLPAKDATEINLYHGKGCPECNNTGFQGRIGIFEVFLMDTEIEKLLVNRATTSEIHNQAVKNGMVTMRQDGFLKALEGTTTIEEVVRYAAD